MNSIIQFVLGFFGSLFSAAKISPSPVTPVVSRTPLLAMSTGTVAPSPPTQALPDNVDPRLGEVHVALTLSPVGLKLIQLFEQCRLTLYQDGNGYWTVGWGHALTDPNGKLTKDLAIAIAAMKRMGYGTMLLQVQADALLQADLAPRVAKVLAETSGCTQGQLDAMVSIFFNIGEGAFATSHVRSLHNAGNRGVGQTDLASWAQLAKTESTVSSITGAFVAWTKVDHAYSLGLFRRRACEVMVYAGQTDVTTAYNAVEAFRG